MITLRPVTRRDASALIRANAANRRYHAPWAHPFIDEAGFDNWFVQVLTGPNLSLLARETSTGGIVGVVNINGIVAGAFHSASLGYYGMAEFGGRGLMTEAVRQASVYGFRQLGLHRLEANIQPANAPSIALVRRLGFRMEGFSPRFLRIGGEWRDHERWAAFEDDLPPGP
jgi:[ribosomal protein S5]-alanine N-acetyltransferase